MRGIIKRRVNQLPVKKKKKEKEKMRKIYDFGLRIESRRKMTEEGRLRL